MMGLAVRRMKAWYEESFGEDYLIVYKHRDMQGASSEVQQMVGWLELDKAAHICDLCCGMGRHALALAEGGFRVTGMDLSEILLEEARRHDKQGKVIWRQGDMRNIPLEESFDAVINVFTSFGYFDRDEENGAVLEGIGRILKDDGYFIIDYLNPGHVTRHLVLKSVRREGNLSIKEKRVIENGFVRKRITIMEPGRPNRSYIEQVKLYGLSDFRELMTGTGLTIERVYGNYDGSAYVEDKSPRLILVGKKDGQNGNK
jgi:SAM-dependent methyltransferase